MSRQSLGKARCSCPGGAYDENSATLRGGHRSVKGWGHCDAGRLMWACGFGGAALCR
jgi:hypothetical protein